MDNHFRRQRYTLSDVFNAANTERNFDYVFWMHVTLDILGESLLNSAGYCLVFLATSLIAVVTIISYVVVLPAIAVPGSFIFICHALWGKTFCMKLQTIVHVPVIVPSLLQVLYWWLVYTSTTLWL